jgi:hypothetical protein
MWRHLEAAVAAAATVDVATETVTTLRLPPDVARQIMAIPPALVRSFIAEKECELLSLRVAEKALEPVGEAAAAPRWFLLAPPPRRKMSVDAPEFRPDTWLMQYMALARPPAAQKFRRGAAKN